MPHAPESLPPSAPVDHDALLTVLCDLYRSTERLADCLGISVACHQGRLPLDVVNPDTFLSDMAEIGFGEANHHLALLGQLCEQLQVQPLALGHAAAGARKRIRLEYS